MYLKDKDHMHYYGKFEWNKDDVVVFTKGVHMLENLFYHVSHCSKHSHSIVLISLVEIFSSTLCLLKNI